MAERHETTEHPKAPSKAAEKDTKEAPDVLASPEGVPYQQTPYPDVSEDNPGPFDDGEGKSSDLLRANQREPE